MAAFASSVSSQSPIFLASCPAPVLERLLHGVSGRYHLETTARLALTHAMDGHALRRDAAGQTCARLGASLLALAWEYDPLDGALARDALTAAGMVPDLPLPREAMVAAVHHFETPAEAQQLRQAQMDRDLDRVRLLCGRMLLDAPGSAFWMREAVALAVYRGELDWLDSLLQRFQEHAPRPLAWVAQRLMGDVRLFGGDPEAARSLYAKAMAQVRALEGGEGETLCQLRLAESFWRMDRVDRAAPLWQQALNQRPWLTSHLLMVHDRLAGIADVLEVPRDPVAICLYSFNKAADLNLALESIAQSRLHGARLVVLDNGSTDATPGILAAWRARLKDRLTTIQLPVNIGAPAARNWLLAAPEVRACGDIIFMDDDATVPEDWLERLFAAKARYPEAGVWGCKVVDAGAPWRIQSADFQLAEPPPMAEPGGFAPAYPRRIRLSGVHHEDMDVGQHDYLRPCASVTGCCHLFTREGLERAGGFDLRFNPTQYDDLEHDLRLCRRGEFPVYQGSLAIVHKKVSGKSSQQERRAMASSLGNLYKLEMDYTDEEVQDLRERCLAMLLADMHAKAAALEAYGMRPVRSAWCSGV
ncbi:glycosyltransferase [Megalodesulfovibrio gigas]|uniref:glycosyltransferase n=1 Tax=Megalodesulfovibrio gigas TaxID=879 RepID=UPI000407641D|nr:glycosyltransferase [Megalodesulfovibrio gigas]